MTIPDISVSVQEWGIIQSILSLHVPQYEIWAFGSRAKRTAKPYSDLDLAIMTREPLQPTLGAALAEAFSESDLPYKVDVVDWSTVSAAFQAVIARDKVVLQAHPALNPNE